MKEECMKILMSVLILFMFTACPKAVVIDGEIKAHWIKQGEVSPMDGVVLSKYTYSKIIQKLDECEMKCGE